MSTKLNPRSQIGIYSATLPSLSPRTGKEEKREAKVNLLVQVFKESVFFRRIQGTLQMPTNSGVGGRYHLSKIVVAEGCSSNVGMDHPWLQPPKFCQPVGCIGLVECRIVPSISRITRTLQMPTE